MQKQGIVRAFVVDRYETGQLAQAEKTINDNKGKIISMDMAPYNRAKGDCSKINCIILDIVYEKNATDFVPVHLIVEDIEVYDQQKTLDKLINNGHEIICFRNVDNYAGFYRAIAYTD